MNRLHKKCFIASAGFHLLLAVILVVGPAFLFSKDSIEDMPTLDFVPPKLIDAAFAPSGGNPRAQLPPPAPAVPPVAQLAPPAAVQPQRTRAAEPPKERVQPIQAESDSLELAKDQRKTHRPEISTKLVTKKSNTNANSKEASEAETRARQVVEQRRRAAELIGSTARSLRNDLSPTTTIEDEPGHGGGAAYANYAQAVKSIYERNWIPPEDAANDSAITKVTVTIASDGSVVSSSIIRASGDSGVDVSVQRTLERVTFIAPFPEGSKDKQRSYTINFNLKAKRLMG